MLWVKGRGLVLRVQGLGLRRRRVWGVGCLSFKGLGLKG